MVDTVRSLNELLTVLFVSGQPIHSITEQDVRDAIVSISLETADFSGLPRSVTGLNSGRFWIDANGALRITTVFTPSNLYTVNAGLAGVSSITAIATVPGHVNVYPVSATMVGSASLVARGTMRDIASAGIAGVSSITAFGIVPGHNEYSGTSQLSGAGTSAANPGPNIIGVRAQLSGAGATTFIAGPHILAVSAAFAASSSLSTNARVRVGASSSLSGSAGISATAATLQPGRITVSGNSGITATPTFISGEQWGAVAISILKSNGNLTIRRAGEFTSAFSSEFTLNAADGPASVATATRFHTSGNYYWEVGLSGGTQPSTVGFGNPSQTVTAGSSLSAGNNSVAYSTSGGVGSLVINGITIQSLPSFITTDTISFALKVGVGWWVRVSGGSWTGAGNAAGDPVAGTNPITSFCSTTGGLGPAGQMTVSNQSQTLRLSQTGPIPWQFVVPSGFGGL